MNNEKLTAEESADKLTADGLIEWLDAYRDFGEEVGDWSAVDEQALVQLTALVRRSAEPRAARYEFDRYSDVNQLTRMGRTLKAQGIVIENADSLQQAMLKAAQLAERGDVLVLRNSDETPDAPAPFATFMPPCPICKQADCRLTYEECYESTDKGVVIIKEVHREPLNEYTDAISGYDHCAETDEAQNICSCKFSDAWRCAKDANLDAIACKCICHRTDKGAVKESLTTEADKGAATPTKPWWICKCDKSHCVYCHPKTATPTEPFCKHCGAAGPPYIGIHAFDCPTRAQKNTGETR